MTVRVTRPELSITEVVSESYQAKAQADIARTKAETAQSAAETSELNAAQSETNAAGSASSAATSATNAANSATAAGASATAAAGSASTAASEATDAATSATAAQTAQTAAETARSGAETAETSAATSATNASGSASSAATSATNAANSANAAGSSATAASGSASSAATQASNAATSAAASQAAQTAAETARAGAETAETNAATSETNAAGSASSAATSATNAANSASNAAGSATAASGSASSAATSASNAATSATAAQSAQTAAETARAGAETAETNAATSETNAAGSAAAASSSATVAAAAEDSVVALQGNPDFEFDKTGWRTSPYWQASRPGSNTAGTLLNEGVTANQSVRFEGTGTIHTERYIPVDTSRTYRMKVRVRCPSTSFAPSKVYAGIATYDENYTLQTQPGPGTNRYGVIAALNIPNDDQWYEYEGLFEGEENDINSFRPGTKFVTAMVLCNYTQDATHILDIDYISFDDVTSEVAALNSANAAATSASNAAASETAAGSSATAAQSAQTAAETARAGAETAETNAATSETNAAGSASAASTSATNAANSATAAGASATAASGSASTAATQASNAATSASAAQAAQTAAETARAGAETAETNAATSETNAAGSASSASTSATNAANSASAAAGSATAASGSASTAATQASNAATSASAAQAAQTAAETARAGAETAETNAATSETNAAGSAAAAAASETVTATTKNFVTSIIGDHELRLGADGIAQHSAGGAVPGPVTTTGTRYFETNTDPEVGGQEFVTKAGYNWTHRNYIPVDRNRRYRITVRVKQDAIGSGDVPKLYVGFACFDANFTYLDAYPAWNGGAFVNPNHYFAAVGATITPVGQWLEFTGEFDMAWARQDAIYVRPLALQNYSASNPDSIQRISLLRVEDITSEHAASQSASAAATSASNAAASETAAGSSASSAATSATNAATQAGNASTSATNASTSETNAAGSATAAATSATNAANSESAAAGSASAAAGSASTASTQASNAATSASAAQAARTAAETAQSGAETAETNAATSATNAAGSASSASSSATVSANAQLVVTDYLPALKPSVPREPAEVWTNVSTTNLQWRKNPVVAGTFINDDPDYEHCYEFPLGTNTTLGHSEPFVWDADRVYEIEVQRKVIHDGSGNGVRSYIGCNVGKADLTFDVQNAQTAYVLKTIADGLITEKVWFSARDLTGIGNPDYFLQIGSTAAGVHAHFHFRQNAAGATSGQVRLGRFIVRDITSMVDSLIESGNAANSATASATSASLASTKATEAATSAAAASSSAVSAGTSAGNAAASESAAAGSVSTALTHALAAQTSSEAAARFLSGGMFANPTFTTWDATTPDGFSFAVGSDGQTITKNTADAKYTNCVELVIPAVVTTDTRIYAQTGVAPNAGLSPQPGEVSQVLVTMELELVSGSWGQAGIIGYWWNGTAGWSSAIDLGDYLGDVTGSIRKVEIFLDRPAAFTDTGTGGMTFSFYARRGASSKTHTGNTIRIHSFDVQDVTANAIATITKAVQADLAGMQSSLLAFRAVAGSNGALLELAAVADPVNGGTSSARISADNIIADGTLRSKHLVIDENVDMNASTSAFRMGKTSATDYGNDGIFFGRNDTGGVLGFGLMAGRTADGRSEYIQHTKADGLKIHNATFTTGVGQLLSVDVTTSQNIDLTGYTEVSLDLVGGGGGSESSDVPHNGSASGNPGSNGGNTAVVLRDGAVPIQSWTANGGLGGGAPGHHPSMAVFSARSPFGDGATAPTIMYDPGEGEGPDQPVNATHGAAGQLVTTGLIDLTGLTSPNLEITIGAGGAGGSGNSTNGNAGVVTYAVPDGAIVYPASVVPTVITSSGTFNLTAGSAFSFPDLGPGIWTLSSATNYYLGLNNLDTGDGGTIYSLYNRTLTFLTGGRPYCAAPSFTQTIHYQFRGLT